MKLSKLQPRQKAIIKSIGDTGELKNRLMELGVRMKLAINFSKNKYSQ